MMLKARYSKSKNNRKRFLSFALLLFFFLTPILSFSQGSIPFWEKDLAWSGDSIDILMDVIELDNKVIMSGGHSYSSDTLDQSKVNSGNSDFWVVTEDSLGVGVFNEIYGGDSIELFSNIITLPDGYIFAGSSSSISSGN